MTVIVRSERPGDIAAVHAVHIAAFPACAEAALVDRMRADGNLVLSLVAERHAEVVGHVAFSRIVIEREGPAGSAVSLAPVAVLPQYQRVGVGSMLIERGAALLTEQGESLIFVLGDPGYYGRFGFGVAEAAPFASDYSGPHLLARRLANRAVPPGRLRYPAAFAALG